MNATSGKTGTSLEDFIYQLQPISWKGEGRVSLEKWFEWPADVFALTSILLSSTGAYRLGVSPKKNAQWPNDDWPQEAKRAATRWRNWIADGLQGANPLQQYQLQLLEHKEVLIDDLYNGSNQGWELCKILFKLHGIADEAMEGCGIVFGPRTSLKMRHGTQVEHSENIPSFYLQANFLLALRGSLSRIPKYRGIVLPKSRTPQVGITLRSFSKNLTFHQTEVDVAWRAFPWFNFDENIINLMVIPWPYEIKANFFKPIHHPKTHNLIGPNRYFHYEPDVDQPFEYEGLIRAIKLAKDEVRRIHMLVFPEMALRKKELKTIQLYLERNLSPKEIPMIITGLSGPFGKEDGKSSGAGYEGKKLENFTPTDDAAGFNRVVLSLYYAGRWHDVVQDKHHKWRVDERQIEQYGLGGVLPGVKTWWEAIQIPRRKLSVLAANSWLTICPLICEDLARLEPVSDLVRGIGPTLLTALLLDGPQIKERWSARYASVFADDPGSSVLSLTAYGMAKRSKIPGLPKQVALDIQAKNESVVGLWKDEEKGWYPIEVENAKKPAIVLTVGANWKSESALDGREETENSAVFSYLGVVEHDLAALTGTDEKFKVFSPFEHPDEEDEILGSSESQEKKEDAKQKHRKVLKMCELTLFTYFTDAVIDIKSKPDVLFSWFLNALNFSGNYLTTEKLFHESELSSDIISIIKYSIKNRDNVPDEVPTPHLVFAVELVKGIVAEVFAEFNDKREQGLIDEKDKYFIYWNMLVEKCSQILDDRKALMEEGKNASPHSAKYQQVEESLLAISKRRTKKMGTGKAKNIYFRMPEVGRLYMNTPFSILWAIHTRLTSKRRYSQMSMNEAELLSKIETIVNEMDYHTTYLEWRRAIRKRYKNEEDEG